MEWMYIPGILRGAAKMISSRIVKARTGLDPTILGSLAEIKAKKEPGRTILIFERGDEPPEAVTYSRLYFQSQKVADELLRRGLGPGDRFAVYMRNEPEVIYCLTAASMSGTVAVVVDPRNKGEILRFILKDSQAKLVVCADDLLDDAGADLKAVGEKNILTLTGAFGEVLSRPDREYVHGKAGGPEHPFQIIYTSGTTGMPKGVVQPNMRFALMSGLSFFFGYRASDVLYTGLSLSHGNAQAVTVYPALARGMTAVVSRRFTKSRLWDITRRFGVTSFSLLGGMASGIYSEPPRADDADNPVRMVVSAGTPMAIFEAFEKRFNVRILEWYATVEGGFTFRPVGKGPSGSFGKASLPLLIDFRVVDEEDRDCPPGVKGELISRMRLGETKVDYHGNPEASKKKTRGGWLRSGDVCHRDERGWLFFDHRKGSELRRHGDFIPPDMVEKVIAEAGEVSDVYVYGVPAATGAPGESDLVAAVSPFPGKTPDPARIFAACRERLPRNFVPSYIQVLPEIPKTPSEKPRDHALKSSFSPDAGNVHRADN